MSSDLARQTAPVAIDPLTRTPLPQADAALPWTGTTIMVRHRPDGTVSARCRGLLAAGATEGEALQALARLVKAAGHAPEPGPTLLTTPRAWPRTQTRRGGSRRRTRGTAPVYTNAPTAVRNSFTPYRRIRRTGFCNLHPPEPRPNYLMYSATRT